MDAKQLEDGQTSTTVVDVHEPADSKATQEEVCDAMDIGDEAVEDETLNEDAGEASISSGVPPTGKQEPLSPEEAAKYDESRKEVQRDLINGTTASASGGRKRKTQTELQAMSTRNYLDETVVPTLLVGMSELARRRPEKPLEWIAKFLLREQERLSPNEAGERVGDSEDTSSQDHNSNHQNAKPQQVPENHKAYPAVTNETATEVS